MTRIASYTTVVCAVLLLCSSSASAQEYEIRLTRQATVGEKYRLSATGHLAEKTTAYLGDAVLQNQNEEFKLELVSDVTILEVSKSNGSTKSSYVIEKCLLTRDGETKALLARGVVVVAAVEGEQTVFKIDGKPVDEAIRKALALAIYLDTGGPNDDEIFGTREKRKVGDSWDANPEAAAAVLKGIQLKNKDDLKGSAKLENIVKIGKEDFLFVSGSMAASNFSLPMPPELQVENSQLSAFFSGNYPTNPTSKHREYSMKMLMSVTMTGQPNPSKPKVKVQVNSENRLSYQLEYLK